MQVRTFIAVHSTHGYGYLAERIADQKFAVKTLVTLYQHSTDIPWRSDTLRDGPAGDGKRKSLNPQKFLKKALRGVRTAATTTTTVLGNVASEIAGTCVYLFQAV